MDFESRKRIEEDIIKSLKKSSVGMIGICGMGGVGKTTMAQRIRERVMKENLFEEVVMVVVSQQIDTSKIQEEIAELLGLKFDVKSPAARAQQLCTRLMDAKRKLIIFDDVWDRLKLEDLGVTFENQFERYKILLTTRSKDVCEEMEVQEIIAMKILTEEEAWILFKEKAGDYVEDSVLLSVAKDIVAECKGLPIALVTAGKALQHKRKSIWEDSLSQLRLANPVDIPKFLVDVYKPLKLSYDYLDSEREQLLFLLCCLFPEDYDIDMEDLTSYFMGLQIFDDITSIEQARNRMHRLAENLKSRFLLIDGWNDLSVRMHDVVRDMAIYIGSKVKNGFLKSPNITSIESSSVNCNWMSVDISNEQMEIPVASRFPNLRLLMLLKSSSNEFSEISFQGMRDLKVLSFPSTWIGSLPPTLGLLKDLQTLCLFECAVENISVIGELTSLEIFRCNGCKYITELPTEIGRLNRLRLMELNDCHKLQRIPFGILSSLVKLEELKMLESFDGWEAEENGKDMRNASLTELECLPNLTCLEIQISDSNLAAREMRLSPKLVKYRLYIAAEWWGYEGKDDEKVMKLKLPSDIGAVGKWIQILVKNTEWLYLAGNGSNNINLEECQFLRNFEFRECSRVKKLVKTKDCKSGIVFPMLDRLELYELENLEEICDGTIILNQNVSLCCNLKSVEISHCSNLRYLFTVSVARRCLLQLEVLEIKYCRSLEQVFRNEIRDDTDGCIEFPKLKTLTLRDLPNLTAFCKGVQYIKFHKLTQLKIGALIKLNSFSPLDSETPHDDRTLFSVSVARRCFSQLEVLEIRDCEAMEQVFRNEIRDGTDGCIEFPKLKKLELFKLPNLTAFCHGVQNIKFPNLTELEIEQLPKLNSLSPLDSETPHDDRTLFSLSVARRCLSQLEVLEIRDCEAMEQVFRNEIRDDTDGCIEFPKLTKLGLGYLPNLTAFCQGVQKIKFPKLTRLEIGILPKLNSLSPLDSETLHDDRTLFSVSVARRCFSQLEVLEIIDCEAMEQVFRNEIRDDTDGCIEFPKLKKLGLRFLPNLTAFCQGVQNIKFPKLTRLEIGMLPKLNSLCPLNSETPHDDRTLFSMSVARRCFSQLEVLEIRDCEAMEQVFRNEIRDDTDGCIEFPKLKELKLLNLPNFTALCHGVQNIKFPNLTELEIRVLPKLNSLCPLDSETPHDDTTPFHFLCNPKVEMSGLKVLALFGSGDNIRNIWCDQIPMNFFNNLQQLIISKDVRSSMPYSIAKNLVSLRYLHIASCKEMVEVIEGNDDDKEVIDIKCLFPALKTLSISSAHKLRRFWQWNHALELPLLEEVLIIDCRVMEAFTSGFLNTPNLKRLSINFRAIDHKKDLNDAIHHHFQTESKKTSMIEEEEIEDANKDEDKDDDKIEHNNVNKEDERK